MRNNRNYNHRCFKALLPAFIFVFVAVTVNAARHNGHADHFHATDPFEPTVTKEESVLLNTAMEMAAADPAKAIQMLKARDPKKASPALDFAIGNLYFQANRLDAAVAAYQAALKKLPKFRSAVMNLGRVYLMQDKAEAAIGLYQQLVTDGQADADILLLLGHALLMQNAPVSAEAAYRQSLLLRPKHADAMLGMAKALMQQERYAEGLALVGEILERDPANRELWSLRANAYLSMGKHDEAARTIEKAARLGCADSDMQAILGDLLLNRDQPEDALTAYERAFRNNKPSIQRVLRAVEGFLMVGDEAGADKMIKLADSIRKSSSGRFDEASKTVLLRLKAELAQQRGRSGEAMKLCEKVLALDPLDGRTMLVLAELQQAAGRLEDAVMTCERAARVKGFEADALVRQAQIEVQRERYSHAVPLLESAQSFRDQPHVARYLSQIKRMAE